MLFCVIIMFKVLRFQCKPLSRRLIFADAVVYLLCNKWHNEGYFSVFHYTVNWIVLYIAAKGHLKQT